MKISIITATYNSEKTITHTLKSVAAQTYPHIEHIIIDGGSSDKTMELVRSFSSVSKSISEPDKGIYDAMNKGIRLATGSIIGILNSDDFYASDDIIEKVVSRFNETDCDALYGNLDFVDPINTKKVVRRWKSSPYTLGSFRRGWHPPHPTFFVKKDIYEKYGLFDTDLQVSADFEIMLRFIEKFQIKVDFFDETIVKMRYGGESTGSLKNILRGNRNVLLAFKKNGISVSPLYPLLRLLPKLKQFIL